MKDSAAAVLPAIAICLDWLKAGDVWAVCKDVLAIRGKVSKIVGGIWDGTRIWKAKEIGIKAGVEEFQRLIKMLNH